MKAISYNYFWLSDEQILILKESLLCLNKNNYIETQNIKEADTVILNMCSVRQSAVDRVYGLISSASKTKAELLLLVVVF
jgi:tRNA A37 methylthiotransferase MiaB